MAIPVDAGPDRARQLSTGLGHVVPPGLVCEVSDAPATRRRGGTTDLVALRGRVQ